MWANAGWKGRIAMMAGIAAMTASILTVINQANVAEPLWLATRSFVREQVDGQRIYLKTQLDPIQRRQIQQELSQLKSSRDNNRDKLFDLTIMQKREGITPEIDRNIEYQKQQLQDRIQAITDKINQLQHDENTISR